MPDEIDQLRMFRSDAPDPSAAAWTHAEEAIAAARKQARSRGPTRWFPGRHVLTAVSALAVLAVAVLTAVTLHALPGASTRTAAPAIQPGPSVAKAWQLSAQGPAAGPLTCPTATICYEESRSSGSGAAPRFGRLYVSTDGARTWRNMPLPSGLTFTSALACRTARTCSAGAEDHGLPAFTVTRDGGRTWISRPLPAEAGVITSLSCTAVTTCRALAAAQGQANSFDEHLVTTDDGRHFTTTAFPAADNIYVMSCPTASHCVAAGLGPASGSTPTGLVLVSDDGGASWRPGTLPHGVRPTSPIDCVDAQHCFVADLLIGQNDTVLMVSGDGGATWQERPLPARYPHPGITALACVSDSTCYIMGWDDKAEKFDNGKATSGSRPIAAVTQDAGLTWQAMGFPEPSSLPPLMPPDVFMSVSDLQCPTANTCIALAPGTGKRAAIYTTVHVVAATTGA